MIDKHRERDGTPWDGLLNYNSNGKLYRMPDDGGCCVLRHRGNPAFFA